MRTNEEILKRIDARKEDDMFGFEWPIYLDVLPAELAKPYLKKDANLDGWLAGEDY